jgi:hypothetical protein
MLQDLGHSRRCLLDSAKLERNCEAMRERVHRMASCCART